MIRDKEDVSGFDVTVYDAGFFVEPGEGGGESIR